MLILAHAGKDVLGEIRTVLEEGCYRPLDRPVEVETWHATAPAGELQFAAARLEA